MNTQDFTTSFTVGQNATQVFDAIRNVRGWWSEELQGKSADLHDEFLYHYSDVHICKVRLTQVEPGKRMVWHIVDNYFNFTQDEKEWTGTDVLFELSEKDGKTELVFTHKGLVPACECFEACREGWTNYINNSLYKLITTGKGEPNPKEGGFNEELIEKLKLRSAHQ